MSKPIRIGTRASRLALVQSEWVAARIREANPGLAVELVRITTSGDRFVDRPLWESGGKGLFVKEIEEALLAGAVDLAVHSAKDLPAEIPDGLAIVAVPPREDPRDALVSRSGAGLRDLAPGAVVGTTSLRRRSQLLAFRGDVRIAEMRGNVDTRLRKVDDGVCDAAILACAGLRRMGLASRITEAISEEVLLPAAGQGFLALEARAADNEVARAIRVLDDPAAAVRLAAERGFVEGLGAGCRTPAAAYALLAEGRVRLRALLAAPDGGRIIRVSGEGLPADARRIGLGCAERAIADGGREILDSLEEGE